MDSFAAFSRDLLGYHDEGRTLSKCLGILQGFFGARTAVLKCIFNQLMERHANNPVFIKSSFFALSPAPGKKLIFALLA
jgi:hypothetical protein